MSDRRDFLKTIAGLGAAGIALDSPGAAIAARAITPTAGGNDRAQWIDILEKLASPVLGSLANRELRKNMPFESSVPGRIAFTHLEAFGRLMAGIAPWLAASGVDESEAKRQRAMVELAQGSLDAGTDPKSPDFLNFTQPRQPLVDAAFLAQGILRAPSALWQPLSAKVQGQIIAALKSSRAIPTPTANNWVMFAATIEAALLTMGQATIPERLESCVNKMLGWYKGDGAYGDGEYFHFDYYNSFVIHPMLVDVLTVLAARDARFAPARDIVLTRARRFAQILERLIAPDGTFPSIGRSTTYRFGAFHALAQIALLKQLPAGVKPAQVRCALTAVMRKMMDAPETFDANGWLRVGFCGHQPGLGEGYISTGSLYLCSVALLPLGLAPADAFWSDAAIPWTSQQLWSGEQLHADHAIVDVANVQVPMLKTSV